MDIYIYIYLFKYDGWTRYFTDILFDGWLDEYIGYG
jgi:hypothetical protein